MEANPQRSNLNEQCIESIESMMRESRAQGYMAIAAITIGPVGQFTYTANATSPGTKLSMVAGLRVLADMMEAEVKGDMMRTFVERQRAAAEAKAHADTGARPN